MLKKSISLFSIIGLLLITNFAYAAQDYSGKFVLEEILIEDDRPESQTNGKVRVIKSEELNKRGVRTLDEALELLPGLNVRVGNGGQPRIDIRGYRSRHVTLLVDGIPINSTFDGQLDPRLIPVEIIEKIKVSYGNSSAIYGPGAIGGVINIITRRGKDEPQKLFLQTETGTRVEQYGLVRATGSEGDFDYFLGLSNELRNGFELSDNFTPTTAEDGGRRENSDLRRSSMLLKIGLTPSERWQWGMTIGHQRGEFGLPHNTIENKKDPFAKNPKYERIDNVDGRLFQLTTAYDAPGPWEFKLWYFYNRQEEETNAYDDDTYADMNDPRFKGTYHQDARTLIRGQNFQAIRSMGKDSSLALSIRTDHSEWTSSGIIRDVPDGKDSKGKKLYAVGGFAHNRHLKNQTLAAEYSCKPGRKLQLKVGGSFNRQKRNDRDDQSENEYNLGLEHEMDAKTSMHFAVARKIRFPAIRQLYDVGSGNQNLDPEKAVNYELGFGRDFCERTSGSLTFFHSKIEDYIEKNDTTSIYENFQEYRFKGIELSARHECKCPLVLQSSLTLMESEEIDSKVGRDELQYRPKVKFSFAGTYTSKCGWKAYGEFLHIDRQVFYTKKAPYLQRSLNEINVTNIRVSKPIRYESLTAYFGVDNLFDRNYETSYGVPAPGRFWYLGLQAEL
jgi:outer membrane cobalamin receptor